LALNTMVPESAQDGTSESMGSSGIERNIFIWVAVGSGFG
jgi:hypothetical protein